MRDQAPFLAELHRDVEQRSVALVLGAGVSAALSDNSPVATWKGLLADGISSIAAIQEGGQAAAQAILALLDGGSDELVTAAQWLTSKFAHMPGEYANWLNRTVGALTLANPTL